MPRLVDDRLLKEITQRILRVVPADRIIIFGSAATGQLHEGSDLDILVLKAGTGDSRRERVRITDSLRELGYPCDVFVMDTDAFDESKRVIGGLAYPANKYGRVIYEAA